jgi:hypothetical protein
MSKVKLTAEQRKVLAEKMKSAKNLVGAEKDAFMARTIGDVYDVELPIPKVIEAIARVERAEVGEHVYYNAPDTITKTVNTITSDCEITQTKVTPNTRTEVTWTDLVTEEVYVCLHEWLKADHDVLEFNADAMNEAMDRQEIYATLALIDAGAVSEGNTYTLDSSKTKFDYPKLVEMARSIAKYGTELVLITGGNITTDVFLMNYDADKNQAVSIFDVVSKHIPVEALTVDIDSVTKTVISADVAYLVAVADSKKNRSLLTVRRKTNVLTDEADTESAGEDKERVVIVSGNGINIGDKRKYAKGFFMAQEYSATSINDKTYAKFTRS